MTQTARNKEKKTNLFSNIISWTIFSPNNQSKHADKQKSHAIYYEANTEEHEETLKQRFSSKT